MGMVIETDQIKVLKGEQLRVLKDEHRSEASEWFILRQEIHETETGKQKDWNTLFDEHYRAYPDQYEEL